MGRSTTRIQNLTKVTTLNTGDVFPTGPISGDRAKAISFANLLLEIDANLDTFTTVVEVAGDYVIQVIDDFIAATGPAIITLPPSADAKRAVTIKSVLGGGALTLTPVGVDTIDAAATQPIAINGSLTVFPVAAGWLIA